MGKVKLVCFDLDDTLIREIHLPLDALPELESRAELVIERLKNGEVRSEN